jgi:hypothetical protein
LRSAALSALNGGMTQSIEVYELKEGTPRPGGAQHQETCVAVLQAPPDAQIPQVGDVLVFTKAQSSDPADLERYRVLAREFLWGRLPSAGTGPQKWVKMWIHVGRLDDEAK